MEFDLARSLEILERTPAVLHRLLSGLSQEWTAQNEGGDTWSAYDIAGHLIHGERTDWVGRVRVIINDGDKKFIPFDRFAQFTESKGKSLEELLDEFAGLRKKNIEDLKALKLTDEDLNRTGIHPAFGEVTLRQLLSTWTVHDLTHIAQVCRVMAKQYRDAIGPWLEYFRLLQ